MRSKPRGARPRDQARDRPSGRGDDEGRGRGGHRHRRPHRRASRSAARPAPPRPGIAGLNTTWFISYAGKNRPEVAIAAVVEQQNSTGGETAAPVAREVLQALLGSDGELLTCLFMASGDHLIDSALRRALPDHPEARLGRDGERLPRLGPGARPPRRDQDPRRPARPRRAVRRAVPPRGAERRRALASEHRLDLRPRRGRGHVLHRDGVRRRADAEGAARRARARRRSGSRSTTRARSSRRCASRTGTGSCTATSSRTT